MCLVCKQHIHVFLVMLNDLMLNRSTLVWQQFHATQVLLSCKLFTVISDLGWQQHKMITQLCTNSTACEMQFCHCLLASSRSSCEHSLFGNFHFRRVEQHTGIWTGLYSQLVTGIVQSIYILIQLIWSWHDIVLNMVVLRQCHPGWKLCHFGDIFSRPTCLGNSCGVCD